MSGRQIAAGVFFAAAAAWGWPLMRAIGADETDAATQGRTVAFLVMIVAGSCAFPRSRR